MWPRRTRGTMGRMPSAPPPRVQRVRPLSRLLAMLLCVAAGCITPATEALIQVGTDIPVNRVVTIAVTVADAQAHVSMPAHWAFDAGTGTSGARAASFAVVPGRGPRDAAITLVLDAVVVPLSPRDTPVTLRRRLAFRFLPGRTITLRVFLSVQCLRPAAGCTTVSAERCTRSVLCDELGQTCGDQGQCVPIAATADAGMDAGIDVAGPDTCVPLCSGRSCGDNGCGGSCGTCASGTQCDPLSGHCVCVPVCAGRECGADQCGGECGTCPTNSACASGHCHQTCGGPGQTCCTSGAPACESGLMCAGSLCVGACGDSGEPCCSGSTCTASLVCSGGTCGACPASMTACSGRCVDLRSDGQNCGTCGASCAAAQVCVAGHCVCPTGQTSCGGQCVDLNADEAHCGTCATVCPGGATCCAGSCAALTSDNAHCGSCTRSCLSGMVCEAGNCNACGAPSQSCCAGSTCSAGNGCFFEPPAGQWCQPCGREGQSCCPGNVCQAGFNCNSTRTDIRPGCLVCGGGGQQCCNGSGCQTGLSCTVILAGVTSLCTNPTPGLPGSACVNDADCSGSSFCRNNYCYDCGSFDSFCCPNIATGTCHSGYACHPVGTTAIYVCW